MPLENPDQYIALVGKTAGNQNQLLAVDSAGRLVISPLKFELSDIDTTNSTTGYYGYVSSVNNGPWIIKKVTNTQIRFAYGTTGYSLANSGWDNRTSLNYVLFNQLNLS